MHLMYTLEVSLVMGHRRGALDSFCRSQHGPSRPWYTFFFSLSFAGVQTGTLALPVATP